MLADKAYDADRIRELIQDQGAIHSLSWVLTCLASQPGPFLTIIGYLSTKPLFPLAFALDAPLAIIPWDLPATLILPGCSRSGATFLEAVRAFEALSLDDRSHAQLVFDDERLPGSLGHTAIEGYIKHLPES